VGIVVKGPNEILVQATLRGRTRVHEEVFMAGILSAGKDVVMTGEEFAEAALKAPEVGEPPTPA